MRLRTPWARTAIIVLILLFFPLILILDRQTHFPLPVWAIYGIPTIIAARVIGAQFGVIVTAIAVLFSGLSAYLSRSDLETSILGAIAVLVIGAVSVQWALAEQHLAEVGAERARLLEETQQRAREVEESRASLLEFFSLVAHDLQSPLATVSGYVQMLARRGDLTAEQREAMGRGARAAIQQVQRLAEDLLDASRVGTGRLSLRKRPSDVGEICRGVVEQRRLAAPTRRLTFEMLEGPLPAVVDPDRIAQAVGNLVDNALKYSPPEGEVRVVVGRTAERARIAVIDQGMGIRPEDVDTLFQPYVRLRSATGVRGLGLGLYIVHGIVEAHGGSISVQSTLGEGSTFTIELPIDEPPNSRIGLTNQTGV